MAAKRSAERSKTARRPAPERPEAAVPQRTAAGTSDTAADCGTPGPIVVGIGASAGGLEAFRTFLDAMPPDNGLAFVFIPHLDPTRESHMVELLASHTAMTVVQAKDGMPIKADHVYVIPPDEYITISDEVLHLTAPSERRGRRIPIDFFFHSLAEDRHEKAIGIVLSGTGTEGAHGLQAIKAHGGLALAQDPETATYDGMPRSAIATGLVDHVLPVERMPKILLGFVQHPYVRGAPATRPPDEQLPKHLGAILAVLHARYRHDFELHKKGTLIRRIQRRMGLRHLTHMEDYLRFLQADAAEVDALFRDLLITVTGFFRDPEAWKFLEKEVIPALVREKPPDQPLRAWVTGCATGEEAYTVAILLIEQAEAAQKGTKVQVFATDIESATLERARAGFYPAGAVADVSLERLRRFFIQEGDHYRVTQYLRDAVVFAAQNLLSDPPFSRLDLVTCRNVLIYLEPDVQESVIALFHFALRPGGYLLLGGSETIGPQDDAFETVSKKWRVYRPIGPRRLDKLEFSMIHRGSQAVPVRLPQVAMGTLPLESKLAGLAQRLVLEHHAPACTLVDRRNEIRYLCGPTHDYLRPPTGVPTQDLLAWAHRDLRSKLRAALDTAAREGRSVTETAVRVQRGEECHTVDIAVTPITVPREAAGLLLVAFADRPGPPAPPAPSPGAANVDEERVRRLELELKVTREDLQGSIGELEVANEDLQAVNEEMLSLNEEYQSTNEELETSKEELQSLNEELTTLNSQLQAKFEESTAIANDLKNLLASTNIATVFLDRRFCIKRFTPSATKLFNLIPTDVGRPLGDLVKKFADPDLVSDAEAVLESLVTATKEIRNDEDLWYVRQVLPYRTQENRIEGVVITFADVTSLKRMEEELLKSRDRVRAIVDTAVDGIITIDEEGTIKSFNPAAERVFGYAAAEVVGQDVTILMPSPYRNEHDAYLSRYLQTGEKRIIGIGREVRGRRKDGSTFPMDLAVSEFHDGNGRKFAGIVRDITERKRLEREVLEIAAGERQRIGQELHDTTCQELAGLGLLAQGLANQVAEESLAEGGVATKIANGIGQALDHLRMILKGLFPVEVDANGLMAAFDELAAQTEALTGITCRFDCAEPITLRDNMTARHLYYIAKEAVTNAVKHGSPTDIGITLDRDGDFVALGVRDNGRGLSKPLDECQGMGLRIMQYRAGLIGATLSIGRVEGVGTMVACRFSEDGHHG